MSDAEVHRHWNKNTDTSTYNGISVVEAKTFISISKLNFNGKLLDSYKNARSKLCLYTATFNFIIINIIISIIILSKFLFFRFPSTFFFTFYYYNSHSVLSHSYFFLVLLLFLCTFLSSSIQVSLVNKTVSSSSSSNFMIFFFYKKRLSFTDIKLVKLKKSPTLSCLCR